MFTITCLMAYCLFNANVNICEGKFDDNKKEVRFELNEHYTKLKADCEQIKKETEYRQHNLGRYGE